LSFSTRARVSGSIIDRTSGGCKSSSLVPDRRVAGRRVFFKSSKRALEALLERFEHLSRTRWFFGKTHFEQIVYASPELAQRADRRHHQQADALEGGSRVVAKPHSLGGLGRFQESQKAQRLLKRQGGRRHGERRGHLLARLEPCDRQSERRSKETLRKDVVDFTLELLEDLQANTDPPTASVESTCDGLLAEPPRRVDVGDDRKLLLECRATPRIVLAQALQLRFEAIPPLHDDPGVRFLLSFEREEALEAVDENNALPVLECEQRLVAVERRA
jgi:hypothetical protein